MMIDRRRFLAGSLALAGVQQLSYGQESGSVSERNSVCAFVKFVQSLSFTRLAEAMADLGFDGIEATVRRRGLIDPNDVEDALPELVEELAKCGLQVTIMATDINRVDDPLAEKVLRTAATLGIKRYRMSYYQYDLSQPVVPQLDTFRPMVRELAALNRELAITGLYQNHAGPKYVGASLWDLHLLLGETPPSEVGAAFDIRHATAEGGTTWPVRWNLMQPRTGIVYVKDFRWDGRKPTNVPLGDGMVDPGFFKLLQQTGYNGPVSLHVEYLEDGNIDQNVSALGTDLKTLKALLAG